MALDFSLLLNNSLNLHDLKLITLHDMTSHHIALHISKIYRLSRQSHHLKKKQKNNAEVHQNAYGALKQMV